MQSATNSWITQRKWEILKNFNLHTEKDIAWNLPYLKVKTDILNSMDKQKVTCLIPLDLSAAFDMVSYDLLLNCLRYRFGVQGQVLEWIHSYLASRTQKVKSRRLWIWFGYPKAGYSSRFSTWTNCLQPIHQSHICRKHNVNYHRYTNDTQNYHSCQS